MYKNASSNAQDRVARVALKDLVHSGLPELSTDQQRLGDLRRSVKSIRDRIIEEKNRGQPTAYLVDHIRQVEAEITKLAGGSRRDLRARQSLLVRQFETLFFEEAQRVLPKYLFDQVLTAAQNRVAK